MKKTIIWILIVGIIGAVCGYFVYRYLAKHDDPLDSKDSVVITAEKLFADYSRFEDSANKLYLGKTIRVSGQVKDIEFDENRYTITFNTNDSNGAVICEMDTIENKKLTAIKPNASIEVAGFCNGLLIDVQMDRGKLAK